MKAVNWESLEKQLREKEPSMLKSDILDRVNFILDNFGQPGDYHNHTNLKVEEINDAIDDLIVYRFILFSEDNESIVKNLYHHCSGKESFGDDYKKFYLGLNNSLIMWNYGEDIDFGGRGYGVYNSLKSRLLGITRLLERGNLPDVAKKSSDYEKELGDTSRPQYS